MFQKLLLEIAQENIAEKFKISNSERYDLRSNNKFLILPKPNSNSMVRTFGYTAAKGQ